MTAPTAISRAERARRRQEIDDVRHSAQLEGLHVTAATRADQEAYVTGQIDLAELGRRTRARYGVT